MTQKRRFYFLMLTLFLAPYTISAVTRITLVTDPWPPYVTGNSGYEPTGGISVKILNRIFAQIETVELKLMLYPWKRALQRSIDGDDDGIWMVFKNKKRLEVLDFTEPLFVSKAYLWYLHENHPKGIHWISMKDLIPYSIGVVSGYEIAKPFYEAKQNDIPLHIEEVVEEKQNFLKILAGRIDLTASNEVVAMEIINANGWKGRFNHIERPIETSTFYIAFCKKSPAVKFIPQINTAINKLKADGTLARLLEGDE